MGIPAFESRKAVRIAIIIILESKARKFSQLPHEQRRDAVPVVPEGVGIS
jgi:hypothetical protein